MKRTAVLMMTLLLLLTAMLPAGGEEIHNPFGKEIRAANWDSWWGSQKEITDRDWHDYIQLLILMDNEGRLKYGSEYARGWTSLKYYNGKLYMDCWGLIKAGAKLLLKRGAANRLPLNGPVNSIYKQIRRKGPITVIRAGDKVFYPELYTGISIFIDNKEEVRTGKASAPKAADEGQTAEEVPEEPADSGKKPKGKDEPDEKNGAAQEHDPAEEENETADEDVRYTGFDHVMTYVEDLTWMDKRGVIHILEHAVVGIGGTGGLQIMDFDEALDDWQRSGYRVAWGDQLEIVRVTEPKFVYADTEPAVP